MEIESEPAGDWDYTVADYVRLEEESVNIKHEFVDGQIRAMAGGAIEHSRLAAALITQLNNQLGDRPCDVYTADSRVRIAGLVTYPDVSVGCGEVRMDIEDRHAQLNPCVLFEVTSKSSEKYDRGKKRARYMEIPSLREYVIVSHQERAVDVYRRDDAGVWVDVVTYGPGERALLPSLGIEIDVDQLYKSRRKRLD